MTVTARTEARGGRRGYPFHPVKTAGALLLGLGVFGGWLMSQAPALTAPTLNPLSSGLLAGATTLSGTATPNSKVQVFVNDAPVGIATVDAQGRWSLQTDLPQGQDRIVAKALQGDTATLESNRLELNVGAGSGAPMAVLDDLQINEPRVDANAFLPNAPFLLSGTAPAGATLEVLDGASVLGTTTAGTDGKWAYTVTPASFGDHDYSVRKQGSAAGPVVTLNIAEKDGTGPACPCNLRFILINPKAQTATVTLQGSGVIPGNQTRATSFQGKAVQEVLYPGLEAGNLSYSVSQGGFKTVTGIVSLPKNRAISVYLDPQK